MVTIGFGDVLIHPHIDCIRAAGAFLRREWGNDPIHNYESSHSPIPYVWHNCILWYPGSIRSNTIVKSPLLDKSNENPTDIC